ncbi:MAG: elongation factor Ts [Rhodospirillales bacterium]|nr:elongation factor Ts [Rhodospirillales bacterium]MBO6786733.1 elongation factor Ts [Rhodospirillales bacterium]
MAEITAALVKELREKSGAGMMDCKKALAETDGDLEAAVDWLRTKGLAAAAKKAGRVAAEGLVGVHIDGTKGAVSEVNAETDFVARNDSFQTLVSNITKLAVDAGDDIDALNGMDYPGTGRTVAEEVTHNIATIGENMSVRRIASLSVEKGVLASYIHNQLVPGLGKIAVLVALESEGGTDGLEEVGKQLAMHIAAARPQSVGRDDLDQEAVERERQVLIEQARESGRPDNIIEKMVEGRLRKFYEEVCLLEQTFVIDGESKVEKIVEDAGKAAGGTVKVAGFKLFVLGEGIEKKEEDFAAEVAAAAGGN